MRKIFVSLVMVAIVSAIIGQMTPAQKTLPNLLEQATGKKFYWDYQGKLYSSWHLGLVRRYKERAQVYSIRAIGELGPEANEAAGLPLLSMFDDSFDINTGDGLVPFRSEIVRTLAMIDAEHAIPVIIASMHERALASEATEVSPKFGARKINWHDADYSQWYDSLEVGPSGIVHSLMWYDSKRHPEIARQLNELLIELETDPKSSEWAKKAIAKQLSFFQGDKKAVRDGNFLMEITSERIRMENN